MHIATKLCWNSTPSLSTVISPHVTLLNCFSLLNVDFCSSIWKESYPIALWISMKGDNSLSAVMSFEKLFFNELIIIIYKSHFKTETWGYLTRTRQWRFKIALSAKNRKPLLMVQETPSFEKGLVIEMWAVPHRFLSESCSFRGAASLFCKAVKSSGGGG